MAKTKATSKKRNVRVDAIGQLQYIAHSITLLYLLLTMRVR